MATEDDILEMLDSKDDPLVTNKFNNSNKFNNKERLWDKKDFKQYKIDPANFIESKDNEYWIYLYTEDSIIPDNIQEKISKIVEAMTKKNWILRANPSSRETTINKVLKTEGLKSVIYLPWKGYNKDIENPHMAYPNELGYRIAYTYNKAFLKLPNPVRALYANMSNIILGKECNNPIKLVLAYTVCGTEKITKETDYKKVGNLSYILKFCNELDIPLINIQKEDSVKRLLSIIS